MSAHRIELPSVDDLRLIAEQRGLAWDELADAGLQQMLRNIGSHVEMADDVRLAVADRAGVLLVRLLTHASSSYELAEDGTLLMLAMNGYSAGEFLDPITTWARYALTWNLVERSVLDHTIYRALARHIRSTDDWFVR